MGSCSTRIAFLFVALWSLAQGVGYLVASILGMRAFDCHIDMSTTQIKYFIYLLYFRNSECGNSTIDWNALQIYPTPEVEIQLPEVTEAAERTQAILLAYLITSILWIVASIMLIVGAFSPCMGRRAMKFFCLPWAIVCCFILLLDVAATYYFVTDIINTWDVTSLIEFLGIPYQSDYYFYFNAIPPHIMILPALMMALLSSRAVAGWFINLSVLIYMCVRIRRLNRKPEVVVDQQVQGPQGPNVATVTTQQQQVNYPNYPQNPMVQTQSVQQQGIYPSLAHVSEAGPSGIKA